MQYTTVATFLDLAALHYLAEEEAQAQLPIPTHAPAHSNN